MRSWPFALSVIAGLSGGAAAQAPGCDPYCTTADILRHTLVPPYFDPGAGNQGHPLDFALTADERGIIVAAMDALGNSQESPFYANVVERIRNGAPLRLGDIVFINRPLMLSIDPRARELLQRLRAQATNQ